MSVPAFLFAVNGEVDFDAIVSHPFVEDFVIVNKVVLGSRAVYNLHGAVVFSLVSHIVDDGAKRSETDTAGDKEEILPFQRVFHGEIFTVGAADTYLLTHFHCVEPVCEASALLDGEFHVFGVCGR